MNKSDKFWIGFIAAGYVVEGLGLKKFLGLRPLSRTTAKIFRTYTKAGKIVFLCAWGGFTWWFVPHICNGDWNMDDESRK